HERTRIKTRSIAFTEIIGLFVGHLRKRLEEDADDTVESVVLGRPVQFVDDDAEADAKAEGELENAARTQGFKH
ncbi:MAG: Hsp70 family protein, partial [Mesorhizobium sp.]